jgi:hypothetical protein
VSRFRLGASGAEKLCALGARPALLGGPSTSPLGSFGTASASRLPDEVFVATITYAHHLGPGQAR